MLTARVVVKTKHWNFKANFSTYTGYTRYDNAERACQREHAGLRLQLHGVDAADDAQVHRGEPRPLPGGGRVRLEIILASRLRD